MRQSRHGIGRSSNIKNECLGWVGKRGFEIRDLNVLPKSEGTPLVREVIGDLK